MERRSRRRWRGSYRARRREKPWSERLADWTRSLVAFLFSNVGIICLVVGYTIAGAFIFIAIEDKDSQRRTGNVIRLRNGTASQLWELTSKENVFSEVDWKTKVLAVLKSYQDDIVVAVRDGYDGVDSPEGSKQWSFAGAFLYSLTVITTIGYGNICPRTEWGKAVTIVYAIVGMPLFLLYLSNIGDILARSFKWTYARCCLCRCRRKSRRLEPTSSPREAATGRNLQWQMVTMHGGELETSSLEQDENSPGENGEGGDGDGDGDGDDGDDDDDRDDRDDENNYKYDDDDDYDNDDDDDDDDDDSDSEDAYDPQSVTVPLSLCLAIMVGYVCGGAILFSEWEDWDFLDGSYFCFISLSTIGFGDIVPGDKIYSGQGFELSFVFCSMYLMLGMALIAMCFNLMQEEVMAKMRSLGRTARRIFRCDR